jgi:hypothetical protein
VAIAYTIEGFNLHQPDEGFKLLEQTDFASEISPRRVNRVVPLMHGEIPAWNDPLDTTSIAFRVRITGATPQELEQRWNHLRSLCMLGNNNPVTIRRESEEFTTFAHMQLQSMSRPDFWCAAGMVQTVLIFHNPYGRWEDVELSEQVLAVPGAQQMIVAAMESTAPISRALFRVRGPLASITVRNPYNDTGFSWTADSPLGALEYLVVDTAGYQAWRNSNNSWDGRELDVSRTLLTEGNGMLNLTAVPGLTVGSNTNQTSVSASGQGANTQLTVRTRRTFA